MRLDPDRLTEALRQIPTDAWSLTSTYPENGVHHGYRRVVLVSAGHHYPHAELFQFASDAMRPVRDAALTWLEPGGFIVPHRDKGPWWERWQIPIITSGEWHSAEPIHPEPAVPFLVRHWEPHAVVNRGPGPRIHLVVDRNVLVDRDPLPFTTYPVPADMADLIERSQQ